MTNVFFKAGDVITLSEKNYHSITLKGIRIDKTVWAVLSGKKIESFNVSDCVIAEWKGARGMAVRHLWIENCTGNMGAIHRDKSGRALKTLILSQCTRDMCTMILPHLGKFHVKTLDLRDVDGVYLSHLFNGTVSDSLKNVRLARTCTSMRVVFAEQLFTKIANMTLAEFSWSESGLGDALIDALETTIALPWHVAHLVLRNNDFSERVYERLEVFKQSVPSVALIDIAGNNFPASLNMSLSSAHVELDSSEESEQDEHEAADMEIEEEDREDGGQEYVDEEDGGETFAVEDDDLRSSGKRKRKREDEPVRSPANARGKTLESLVARYWGTSPSKHKISIKRL